jgi:hypothetical protein
MSFTEINNQSVLPAKSKNCPYDDGHCYNLYSSKTVIIEKSCINNIEIDLLVEIPNKYIIQIRNHLCDKPWRVLQKYIYPDEFTKRLTITLITRRRCKIIVGDILCHIKLVAIDEAYKNITGKRKILKNKK